MKPFDASGAFRPIEDGGGVRRLAVQGAGATVFSSAVSTGIQIVATVVLARLLLPIDFGVVTMATTFSLLVVNFGLNGFTEAILQWEEMDHALASNLFWINTGGGMVLTAGFAAAGSWMAHFYGNPLVKPVAVGVALTILLTSLSVVHLALLKRAMRFAVTSANDIVAGVASVAVSIVFAALGWGYWALVAGLIARPLFQTLGAWYLCRWMPGLPHSQRATLPAVRFAMNIYGRFTVNYFSRNTDNLLVGWRFNATALGFYKKAYDLFALSAAQLVAPLSNVAVSALSRLGKDSAQYRRYLLSALGVVAFIGMGLGADLTLIGRDLIRLLLGPQWAPAGRIFTYFGPGVGMMLLYGTHGWIHLSIGRADRWLRWGIIEVVVTILLFIAGLPWGPEGIAVAWTASFWILTLPALWYAGKPIGFGVGAMVAVVWRYVAASFLAGGVTVMILREVPALAVASSSAAAFLGVVAISLLFAALYLGAVILLHGGCAPIYQLVSLTREMVPWEKFSKRPAPAVGAACGNGTTEVVAP
ncbi:MAG TPA: lipopolysaccharide biosynthesis protein [Terriglobales bacterium]|nr:lipopolysaccharide biosynthesis protein [Terriglobales bacterium]